MPPSVQPARLLFPVVKPIGLADLPHHTLTLIVLKGVCRPFV